MRRSGDLLPSVTARARPEGPPAPAQRARPSPPARAARRGDGPALAPPPALPGAGAGGGPEPGAGGGTDPRLAALLRDVVALAERQGGADGLVVDAVVDGWRCLVVCAPDTPSESRLSPREREIARMVAAGYPNKTIAAALDISTWTVGSHLRRIFAKLDVTTRAAMTARLARADALERLLGDGPEA